MTVEQLRSARSFFVGVPLLKTCVSLQVKISAELVEGADVEHITRLHLTHKINNLEACWGAVRTECVRGFVDAVLDQFSQVTVVELSIWPSLETSKGPVLGVNTGGEELVSVELHYFLEHFEVHIVNAAKIRLHSAYDVLHPLVVGSAECSMPMIEDGKFHRHMTARASFDSGAALFDFFPKVERPFGVCSRSVQDRGNIVFQNYRRKEANIDVAGDLEDIFVLPELHVSPMPRFSLGDTDFFCCSSLNWSQGLYLPSSLTESSDSAM